MLRQHRLIPGNNVRLGALVSPRKSGPILALLIGLALLTLAVYSPVRHYAFLQFDDADYVTENGAVRAGLTMTGLRWALTTPYAGNWHPLTWVSHMADVQLFGLAPGWHHLSSLWLHILTTLLLFRLLARMTGSPGPSAFVTALFALHPLHVESVAWVAERKDVLSTLWWVLTTSAYVAFVRRPAPWRYGVIVMCFGLALMSKPMVVTLPFLLLLLDVWPLNRWRGLGDGANRFSTWALVREKLPLFVMAAAAALVTFIVQQQAGAVRSLDVLPLSTRLAKIPIAYMWYVANTIWPSNLAALYPYPSSIPLWQTVGAVVVLTGISVWTIRHLRTQPYLFVGWAWFVGTLVPVIGLVQAGSQPYADRFMYVPAIGLFVMAAWSANRWASARPGSAWRVGTIGIVVVLASAVVTFRQVAHWKDSVTLWEHAVAVTQDNYRAQTNLGFALAEAGSATRAQAAYREALRINPEYPNAHNYLGALLADRGEHDRAAMEFEAAIRLRPRFPEAHNNLGLARVEQGRMTEAVAAFQEAIRQDPFFAPARNNLAIAYVRQDQPDKAVVEFAEAVRLQPGSPESHMNLGSALAGAGRPREALAHFETAERLGGDRIQIHHAWGSALIDLGDMPGAITHFTTVLKMNPGFAPTVHAFGRSLALSGKLDEALEALQSAVRLEPGNANFHYDFGATLARRGMIAEAIAEMRTTLQIAPDHAGAQDALRTLIKK